MPGASLFNRTTRAVTLTQVGRAYLDRIEALLADLDEADHEVRGSGELRGLLRVWLSSSLAVREVIPRLPRFTSRHPALEVQLAVSDQRQDLLADGIDVLLRMGKFADSNSVARPIGTWARGLAASPYYLESLRPLRTPADLASHAIVLGPMSATPNWSFQRNGQVTTVRVAGRLVINSNEGAIAAAVAGLGVVFGSFGACRRELEEGHRTRVLEDWDMEFVELHAVYPGGKAATLAARAFGDFLTAEFQIAS